MKAWDGMMGVICLIPGFRRIIGLIIWAWRLRKKGFLAWPNISAGKMIVPEKIGKLPEGLTQLVRDHEGKEDNFLKDTLEEIYEIKK